MPPVLVDAERRRTWLKERLTGLGASDVPVLFGLSPWKSPYALWLEKTELKAPLEEMSEPAEWGLRLESAIAAKFGEETRRLVPDGDPFDIQRHPDIPILMATVDRDQVLVPDCERPTFDVPGDVGVLELKTAAFQKASEWEDGDPPLVYQVQLQAQLLVTGRPFGSLAVLIGGQRFLWADLPAHPEFQRRIVQEAQAFWRLVQDGTPPDVDASDATRAAIRQAFPAETTTELIPLPDEAIEWDTQRLEAAEAIKAWEARKQHAENQLRAAIGIHTGGVTPHGVTYTLKTQKKKSYVVAASETRVLRRKGNA